VSQFVYIHRLSIDRLTKRGKEKSPSDGHCQCKKEMDDHLLASQQIFEKLSHSVTHPKGRASFLKITTLMTLNFLERLSVIIVVLLRNGVVNSMFISSLSIFLVCKSSGFGSWLPSPFRNLVKMFGQRDY
jgi:hypothetical protein